MRLFDRLRAGFTAPRRHAADGVVECPLQGEAAVESCLECKWLVSAEPETAGWIACRPPPDRTEHSGSW